MMWPRRLACVLCCLTFLGAARPVGPQEAVHRWLGAVAGGHAARKARRVVLRAAATEDGIPGRITEWLDGDAWRRVTSQGPRIREEVCRGETAWVKDWNGKALELRGRDRRDQLTEATIEALLFGDASRAITAAGEATPSGEGDAEKSTVVPRWPRAC